MRVQDIMITSPKYCDPSTNLAAATELLWSRGCGALPVVDRERRVVGMITDRDICVALGTRDRRASELRAEQAMSRQVISCRSSDDIHAVLKTMCAKKVRRVPVVDDAGRLEGIVCMSDLILRARHDDGNKPELSYQDVVNALKGIHWLHSPIVVGTAEAYKF